MSGGFQLALLPQLLVIGQILLKILERVHINLMLLQQSVQIPPRREAEQRAEPVTGEATLTVGLEDEGFEGSARGVLAEGS